MRAARVIAAGVIAAGVMTALSLTAAGQTALPPRPFPAPAPPPGLPAPFGRGTLVELTASKQAVKVYVARPRRGLARPEDHEFLRVGMTPLGFELPPGVWLIEVENEDVSRATLPVEIGHQRKVLAVHTGSAGLGEVGTLMLGFGAALVLAGGVIMVSFAKGPGSIDKAKLTIPMFAGGGGLAVSGLTMWLLSRTEIEEPRAPGHVPEASGARRTAGVSLSYAF